MHPGRRIHQPKCCFENNKDEDTCVKNMENKRNISENFKIE